MIGGTVGGVIGALPSIAAGPLGLLTAPTGAGLGYAAGSRLRGAIRGEPLPPIPEMAGEVLTGAGAEMGGQVVAKGVSKALEAGSRKLIPFVKGAQKPESKAFQQAASELDIVTSAAERSGSPTLAQVETLPTRAPFGAGAMRNLTDKQLASQKAAAERFAFPPGKAPAPSVLGQDVQAALRGKEEQARAAASRLYDAVEQMVGDQPVVAARNLSSASQSILSREAAVRGVHKTAIARPAAGLTEATAPPQMAIGGEIVDPARAPAALVQQYGLDQPRTLTFQTARDIQSRLGAAMSSAKDRFVRKQLGELHAAVGRDIDDFAAASGEEIGPALAAANRFFKRNVAQVFVGAGGRKAFAATVQKTKPENVIGSIRTVSDAINLRRALGPGAELAEVQRGFMQRIVDEAVDPQTGAFRPQTFLAQMDNYTPEFRRALLGESAPPLEKFLGVLRRQVQFSGRRLTGQESGAGFLGATQLYGGGMGILGGLLAGSPTTAGVGGAYLLTPVVMAKMLTSPRGIRLLTEGVRMGPGTQQAARLAAQIAAFTTRDDSSPRP